MPQLKKVLLKIVRNGVITWVHFCYAPEYLQCRFFRYVCTEKSCFGEYLSRWALEDFNLWLPMTSPEDITVLKNSIEAKYREEFSGLYDADPAHTLRVSGWIRHWVSQHMNNELEGIHCESNQ